MAAVVLKGGLPIAWGNIVFPLGGNIIQHITAIDFGYSQKKENIMGAGFQPVNRGRGNYTYDQGKLTIAFHEWKAICLASPGGEPCNIPPFTIPISYTDQFGTPLGKSDFVGNVEFTGATRSFKQGETILYVEVGFIYAGVSQ